MAETYDAEIQHLEEVLSTVVRLSRHTRQALEQQMGLSSGYLSKLLGGTVELRVRHVLLLADVLQVEPADLFRIAFPNRLTGEARAASRRFLAGVEAALGQSQSQPFATETDDESEIDEQVKRSLARLLGLSESRPRGE